MIISLSKPFHFKDKDFSELELNLDDLTGQDLIDVEEDLKRKNITVNAWEFSRTFLISVAARALRIPSESLKTLPAKDFTSLINETLIFLNSTGSQTVTPKSSGK